MSTKPKHIDSHWLIYAVQGVLAILFGWFITFTGITSVNLLVSIVACALLIFGIIDVGCLLYQVRHSETETLSLTLAVVEVVTSLFLLFVLNQHTAYALSILAVYTITHGILEIILGFKLVEDRTDKAIWIFTGMCGTILGFVILNSGRVHAVDFIKAFGIYVIIYGVSSLIYGLHNRDQKLEYKSERRKIAKKSAKKASRSRKKK